METIPPHNLISRELKLQSRTHSDLGNLTCKIVFFSSKNHSDLGTLHRTRPPRVWQRCLRYQPFKGGSTNKGKTLFLILIVFNSQVGSRIAMALETGSAQVKS